MAPGISVQGNVPRVLTIGVILFMLAQLAAGQAQTTGQWTTLSYGMPINPVHVALLNTGKLLVVAGSGNDPTNTNLQAAIWDLQAGTITVQSVAWDMFCNGMVVLPDGRPLIDGGTLQYDPFHGQPKASVFDPATGGFTNVQSMAHGRWYPTVTTLANGTVMAFSGLDENGNTNVTVEIYTPGSGWSSPASASWTPPLYPWMHLLPSGKVFYSGPSASSRTFDPTTQTWSSVLATTNFGSTRTYGSSVLLPLTPANNYDPKVMILGGANPSTATTEIIDMGASSPSWKYGPSMSQPRIEMNAVILPSGKVLAVGGSLNDEDPTTASLNADLYDPASNTFSSAGANVYPRLYHSVALLLPDATVALAGGNPVRGSYEQHIEIYTPAYLFNADGTSATRPTISSAPSTITWGSSFTVQTPDAANISSVVLVRNGAVTHAFNMDQRLVGLSFTAGTGTLTVTDPPNNNVAPPGYYMLFLLNSSGVPSLASMVQIQAQPDFAISATPSSQSVAQGGSTTFTVNVTPSNGFSGSVALSVSGLPSGATSAFNPTSITGTGSSTLTVGTATTTPAGTYPLTITGTSGSLSHTAQVTLVVKGPPPTVTAISPTSGPMSGGTAVSITGTNFMPGASVSFGGTAGTNVNETSSTSIQAITPKHSPGTVNVVVTNPDGQSATLTNGFTYFKKK